MLSRNCAHTGPSAPGCRSEKERFSKNEIYRLYEGSDYPLGKALSAAKPPNRVPFTGKAQDSEPQPGAFKKMLKTDHCH